MIGTRLGPYEVSAQLGQGGMGEVYRAIDTRLKRAVAIKVLPEAFTADPERMARFEREAQLLAKLQHPNIASIYGLEELAGARALVMELVEGADLSAVIGRGALPLEEAVAIARQIADALEAAHDLGIIHRDLKPANIKLTPSGVVKVLDFGLAKAVDPTSSSQTNLMNSPTMTAHMTQHGMVLGTAAYMAPEQAKGRAVDRRADIWAFGVVLYEMLTGQRAFSGDDPSEVLASVLKSEPDWQELPAKTPISIRRLLRRCLEKDPHRRLSGIGDARLELEETEPAAVDDATLHARRSGLVLGLVAVAGALGGLAVAALLWRSRADPDVRVARLSIVAPPGVQLFPDTASIAVSPDGRHVAFAVGSPFATSPPLYVRSVDSLEARRVADLGGPLPFWSPDSSRLGFMSNGKLRTLSLDTGQTEVLCNAHDDRGGAWSPQGVLLFCPSSAGPIFRVSAHGGEPEPATVLDPTRKELGHRFPTFLPDGEHFLYAVLPAHNGKFDIFVGSLHDKSRILVGALESSPVYSAPGWLLFSRQTSLFAQRFDPHSFQLSGDPIALLDQPGRVLDAATSFTAGPAVSASTNGTLAYYSSGSNRTKAVWLESTGEVVAGPSLPLAPGYPTGIALAPDGSGAALVSSLSPSESTISMWVFALGGLNPLSTGGGVNEHPVWSPDGSRIVFASDRDGVFDLYMRGVGDARPEQPFFRSSFQFKDPYFWSADGKWIGITQLDPKTQQDIYVVPVAGGPARILVGTPGRDDAGAVSPNGKWMTYLSDEGGPTELYAQSFPEPGHRVRISNGGAGLSWWSPDQRHIYFTNDTLSELSEVDVEAGETLKAGLPHLVTRLPPGVVAADATPDRKRWVLLVREGGEGTITVVQNWRAGLPH